MSCDNNITDDSNNNKNNSMLRVEIGDNVLMVPISLLKQSSLFESMLSSSLSQHVDYNSNNNNNNVQTIPGVSEATNLDYILYLLQQQNRSKSALIDKFNHCSVLDDEGYLIYCIQQLLTQHYDDYTSILSSLNINLQYEIYVHSPLILIPKSYTDNDMFIKNWIVNVIANSIVKGDKSMMSVTKNNLKDIKNLQDVKQYLVTNNNSRIEINFECVELSSGKRPIHNHIIRVSEQRLFVTSNYASTTFPSAYLNSNGIQYGPKIWFHTNGNRYIQENYYDNLLHGTRTEWYINGNLKEETQYENGYIHGVSRIWYETDVDCEKPQSQQIQYEIQYERNVFHGSRIGYYQSGNKRHHDTFHNGTPYGEWIYWFDIKLPSGLQPVKELTVYQNGLYIGRSKFDTNGNVVNRHIADAAIVEFA